MKRKRRAWRRAHFRPVFDPNYNQSFKPDKYVFAQIRWVYLRPCFVGTSALALPRLFPVQHALNFQILIISLSLHSLNQKISKPGHPGGNFVCAHLNTEIVTVSAFVQDPLITAATR